MKISRQLAFCGLSCALVGATLLASLFPYADIALAAIAGIWLVPVALELGTRYAVACYAVSALISVVFIPWSDAKWLFAVFFGFYPFIKIRLDLWYRKTISYIAKFVVFNVCMIAFGCLLFFVIGLPKDSVLNEQSWWIAPLALAANVVFLVYDYALWKVIAWYRVGIHPFIKRFFR